MTFDYSSITATALAQIADKGRPVEILYKTAGTYDPTADSVSGDSIETVEVNALVTNFNRRDVAAGLVEAGDIEITIAALGVAKPKTNDIIVDGEEFTIVTVNEIKPGSVPILYKLQARKG